MIRKHLYKLCFQNHIGQRHPRSPKSLTDHPEIGLGHHNVRLPGSGMTNDVLGSFKAPFGPFSTYVLPKKTGFLDPTCVTLNFTYLISIIGFKQTQTYKHKIHISSMQTGTLLKIDRKKMTGYQALKCCYVQQVQFYKNLKLCIFSKNILQKKKIQVETLRPSCKSRSTNNF